MTKKKTTTATTIATILFICLFMAPFSVLIIMATVRDRQQVGRRVIIANDTLTVIGFNREAYILENGVLISKQTEIID